MVGHVWYQWQQGQHAKQDPKRQRYRQQRPGAATLDLEPAERRASAAEAPFLLLRSDAEQAARVLRERIHVALAPGKPAEHAERHAAITAVIVAALERLLQHLVAVGAELVARGWIECHRAEDSLQPEVGFFDGFPARGSSMGGKRALSAL